MVSYFFKCILSSIFQTCFLTSWYFLLKNVILDVNYLFTVLNFSLVLSFENKTQTYKVYKMYAELYFKNLT